MKLIFYWGLTKEIIDEQIYHVSVMSSALAKLKQGKGWKECRLQGPVFSYFQGFPVEEESILVRFPNSSSLSLSSRRHCD